MNFPLENESGEYSSKQNSQYQRAAQLWGPVWKIFVHWQLMFTWKKKKTTQTPHNIYFDTLEKVDSASEYIWGLPRQDWNSIRPLLYAFEHFKDKHFNK